MSRPTLTLNVRSETGKSANRRLRKAGGVPGTVYGNKVPPVSVTAEPKAVVALLTGELGVNSPIDATIGDEAQSRLVLVKDYQVHPVRRTLVHVDYWQLTPEQVVTVRVPFKTVGKSNQEQAGATLRIVRKYIAVRCVPDAIPAAVVHDVSDLADDARQVMMSEVSMPEGIEAVYKRDFAVVQVKAAKGEAQDAGDEGSDDAAADGGDE